MNDCKELIADLRHYFYDEKLVLDAADAIEQLVEDNESYKYAFADLHNEIANYCETIADLEKERDTAVDDLKELAVCDYCKWLIGGDCTDLEHEECHGEHWEWRGVQEASE